MCAQRVSDWSLGPFVASDAARRRGILDSGREGRSVTGWGQELCDKQEFFSKVCYADLSMCFP